MDGKKRTDYEDVEVVEAETCTEVWLVKYENDKEVSRTLWKSLPRNPGGSGQDWSLQDLFDDTVR